MKLPGRFWNLLWEQLAAPRVDPQRLEAGLERARQALPVPVVWLLGKAQSGKTSIIRALTGSSRAEIGSGFRPCTRSVQAYDFPDQETCFLRFLDTRGLGEVAYQPDEDMRVLEDQAHLLVVVVKAMDHAQQGVIEAVQAIHRRHPDWPLIVAQTTLHEGYAAGRTQHGQPYPFGQSPLPADVPADLARSLAAQRQWFAGLEARFVPLDFTLPEDGYEPEFYGLDALWAAVEEVLPLGLRAMLGSVQEARRPLRDAHFQAAHPHVISYALAAGAAAAVPLPVVDIPLVLAIQGKMFQSIASIYGQQLSPRRMTEIASTLGTGFLARYLARLATRDLLKLVPVPGLGEAAAALYAAACTYALGLTLCAYFTYVLRGDLPDPQLLRRLCEQQFIEGRRRLGEYLKHMTRPSSAKEPTA